MESLTGNRLGLLTGNWVEVFSGNFALDKMLSVAVCKWSKFRYKRFRDSLYCEIAKEFGQNEQNGKVDDILSKILSSKRSREMLFDAYRSISLSKSKSIGPRIIGLLTAKILVSKQKPSLIDEIFFNIAEELNDSELIELSKFLHESDAKIKRGEDDIEEIKSFIRLSIHDQAVDNNDPNSSIDLAPIDLREYFNNGTWALKLKNMGIFSESIYERKYSYYEDGERGIDQDGIVRKINWYLFYPSYLRNLADLIDRAKAMERV